MRNEYDFPKKITNPYYEKLSKDIVFRLDFDSIEYFRKLGEPYGLPAEEMIHVYLRHLADSGYKADLGIPTLKEREGDGKRPPIA